MKVWEALEIDPNHVVKGTMFGIECETEGRRLPQIDHQFWRTEADGSLRDGLEYVSHPLKADDVEKALTALFQEIKNQKGIVNYSFRCSTHVHVNVQDLEQEELFTMIFLYMLYENVFMNYVHPDRVGNRFCLRFQDAGGLHQEFIRLLKNTRGCGLGRSLRGLRQEVLKYAALNMYTLIKYGTLEFRALEGTNDVKKIHNWTLAIENLRDLSVVLKNPNDAYDHFLRDPESLAEAIFKHDKEGFLKDDWRMQVEEAYSQTQAILAYL